MTAIRKLKQIVISAFSLIAGMCLALAIQAILGSFIQ
jgi:hypothetical protein